MRCEDLTRELASPTGALSQAQMAGHLAACPGCAEWSRRAKVLDRAWEVTRPAGPSMDAMDTLWARASFELDGFRAPATLKFAGQARRRWAVAAFVVAQAAAVLVAALVLLDRGGSKPVEVAVKTPVRLDVNVPFDSMAVVRIPDEGDAPRVETQDQSHLYSSSSLPSFTPHDEVGDMEAGASSLDVVSAQ